MKNKKVYIGISIGAIAIIGIIIASIFYIKSKNEKIEQANLTNNEFTEENEKQAMEISEERDNGNESTNDEKEKNEVNEENQNNNNNAIVNTEIEKEQNSEVKKEESQKKVSKTEKNKTETQKATKAEAANVEVKKEISVTDMSKTMYVKATSLNVRSAPSTSDAKIGSYKNGAEVKITGKVNDSKWYRVSYNNKVGYVDSTYLTETKPVEEKKVENTTTGNATGTVSNLIIINSRNNTLRYYTNGNLFGSYSCATGKSSTATPTGICKVVVKIVNRPYYKNHIKGGAPNNPLGKRWMGLNIAGTDGNTFAIHGTNAEKSIGTNASHGCVRMHNSDVEYLYDYVPIGTTVIIKNTSESDKQIAADYGILIN